MHLYEKPVCPGSYGSLGNGGYVCEMSRSVAGVHDYGEMAEALDNCDGADIHREADTIFEGPYAAFTQYHLLIAFGQKVVCCCQPFHDSGGKAPLQQDGVSHLGQLFQKREVLHVASAHLQYIGMFGYDLYILDIEDLGYYRDAEVRFDLSQHLQSLLLQALEAEGRGAGLEGATPDYRSAEFLDRLGGLHELLLALHRAGTGHDYNPFPAYLDPIYIHYAALRVKLSRGKLIRLHYPGDTLHTWQNGEDVGGCLACVAAQDRHHRLLGAQVQLDLKAQGMGPVHYMVYLLP